MFKKVKIIMTDMFKRYMVKLAIRVFIFISIFIAYITQKEVMYEFMTHEFTFGIIEYGISPLHVLWLTFMVMMILHLFPTKKMPSGQILLIGITSCTFLGTLYFSFSCIRIVLIDLIIFLQHLLLSFGHPVFHCFVVGIFRFTI